MRKRLSIILCIALILCMIPTTSAFAAKKVKSKSVSVAPKSMTLAVGDAVQLSATMKPAKSTDKLSWSSSNSSVATVTSKGMVQGIREGSATITVKTSSKKTATCTVVVKKYATDAELRESLKKELKSVFATKDDIQTILSQKTYTKDEIDTKFSEIPTVDAYTKSEVDSKIAGIKIPDTYSKAEIDSKIAAIPTCDCKDTSTSGNVPLHEGQKMTFSYRGKSTTITSISITKSLYNDIYTTSNGFEGFGVYKYNVRVEGTTEVVLPDEYAARFLIMGDLISKNGAIGGFAGETDTISNEHFEIDSVCYSSINADEFIIYAVDIDG